MSLQRWSSAGLPDVVVAGEAVAGIGLALSLVNGKVRLDATGDAAPAAHAATHYSGGSDPIALGSLGGALTASQHGNLSAAGGTHHHWDQIGNKPATFTPAAHSHTSRSDLPSDVAYLDRFGVSGTSTVIDWNDQTLPGAIGNLLYGSNPNGPTGTDHWFHTWNLEYGSKTGTGNVTQFAIPYSNNSHLARGLYYRGRYQGNWSSWYELATLHKANTWSAIQTFSFRTLFASGSVLLPGIAFTDDPDSGLRRSGSDVLRVVTGGVDRLEISSSAVNMMGTTELRLNGNVIVDSGRNIDAISVNAGQYYDGGVPLNFSHLDSHPTTLAGYGITDALSANTTNLADLVNVVETIPSTGHLLMRSGTNWVNATRAEANVADRDHLHDDRYYTETETNTLLSGKADATHTHANITVTAGSGLTGGGALSGNITINAASHAGSAGTVGTLAIAANTIGVNLGTTATTAAAGNHNHSLDTLSNVSLTIPSSGHLLMRSGSNWINATLGQAGIAPAIHDHDDRYYTESEVNALFTNVAYRNTANTFTGAQTFNAVSYFNDWSLYNAHIYMEGNAALILNKTSADHADIYVQRSTSYRWIMRFSEGTESGSNAGSNFHLYAYADNGAYLSNPLTIYRISGAVLMSTSLTVGTAAPLSGTNILVRASSPYLYVETEAVAEATVGRIWYQTADTNGYAIGLAARSGAATTGSVMMLRLRQDRLAAELFTTNGLRAYDASGVIRGYLYHDGATGNFGLLDAAGAWRVRVRTSGIVLAGANVTVEQSLTVDQSLDVDGTNMRHKGHAVAKFIFSTTEPTTNLVEGLVWIKPL